MFEIRIHSRGGQGGVTAARLLAMAAFLDKKHATAAPFYGAERRGAPVTSFVRIDEKPIKIYSQIRSPNLIVVLDASIMDAVDVLQGILENGTVLINSPHPVDLPGVNVLTIDLTGIALSVDLVVSGSPILNTPVLGALAKMGVISRESAEAAIRDMFADERNVKAAEAAYKELTL
ncbi:MAG: Pyruvate ferredoxin oxidoreductase, gamma subunit [Methanomicrobiales archaeon 53_19]|jgi:pyruvate ferredoxin oxidoreductase, gamma subunit (EC 1.2.7.1)|uniref:2-oxoacid:acceptor oxidoreductase family protein n=1 Tax=Methanocalculus sp. TaxID=2004547 RepID=UPI000748664E|nr:2-oxoacid:acceptor oxidoreductase family protein [Methanocalculus sp.]KUL01997.1 MAG: Pyruvate ferredoxin oxidoreductase, gamma subunit [Methanomicrobiales archaeon 53_19]HIJ06224.1 pyruvate ferredoxin oxidoreductase [Methanocalculus sp.]